MSDFYTVEDDGTVIVTTTSGATVECMPVADLLLRVGQNLKELPEPEPPTYTITGVGGATDQRPHDATSIEDPKTSDDERAAWAAYVEKHAAWEAETAEIERQRGEMRGRFMALRGVKVRGVPDDLEAWAAEQVVLFGFEIADGALPRDKALLLAYIDQNVIRTPIDGAKVTAGILRASGLDQEALDSVEATFRDTVGQGRRADAGADTPIPAEAPGEAK